MSADEFARNAMSSVLHLVVVSKYTMNSENWHYVYLYNIWPAISQFSQQSTLFDKVRYEWKMCLSWQKSTNANKFWVTPLPAGHLTLSAHVNRKCFRLQALNRTALNIDYRWTTPPPPGISRLHPEFLQFEALFPLWSNVSKICVLYMKFKRSFPQNVTGFWPAQRVFLFYFLNLSRADLWLDNTAAFSSLCFLSFSNLTLSSTVFLITSWGVNKTREMSQTLQIWQKYCNVTASIFSLYSGLLTLWSSWATCFLRFSTLPAELRPFFLYLGTNFSLASGSKPWGDKKCF